MLRKRYLTIQEIIEAKARIISILVGGQHKMVKHRIDGTHRVVKFMVKVKLVEKRAKRRVGNVMVVKVMIQISSPGIPLAMTKKARPRRVSHEVDSIE